METYENKIAIESCVKTIHKQQRTEHKVQSVIDELEMAYDKAKAFDEIVEIYSDNDHYSDEYVMETIQEQIDLKEGANDER